MKVNIKMKVLTSLYLYKRCQNSLTSWNGNKLGIDSLDSENNN